MDEVDYPVTFSSITCSANDVVLQTTFTWLLASYTYSTSITSSSNNARQAETGTSLFVTSYTSQSITITGCSKKKKIGYLLLFLVTFQTAKLNVHIRINRLPLHAGKLKNPSAHSSHLGPPYFG